MKIILENIDSCIFEVYSDKQEELSLKSVNQVHGNIVLDCKSKLLEADGLICLCGKCILAIRTADCLPIAIIGKDGHALIHAGWRGLENNILKNSEIEKINPTHFFIGPHISCKSYEVSEEFLEYFDRDKFEIADGKYHFSMEKEAKQQILEMYPESLIKCSNACTFLDHRYNSYRRNKTEQRNWNILRKG